MRTDTIAAIATALSDSGIGIIRISGPDAVSVADSVFCTKSGRRILSQVQSHTIHYGYVIDLSKGLSKDWKKDIVDEGMAVVMRAPRSYTAEDTVEIQCHGGVLVMQKVLETVIRAGARLAEPGEFTKRAFLNGRIDLSRAEAVIDVIHSQNEYALKSSVQQLKGVLFEQIKDLREKIIYEIALIESALDDPEHISLEGYGESLSEKLIKMRQQILKLLETADNGRIMKEGISTVIVGKPNAGKSSLLNVIVGEDRAIVTDIAGTTRDVLQETVKLHGISLNIIDTAGIRDAQDAVEKIGVEKAKKYAQNADLILYVVDSSIELDDNDREIIDLIKDKKTIILMNKTDLQQVVTEEKIWEIIYQISDKEEASKNIYFVRTSTKENTGIDIFEDRIKEMFFHGQLQSNHEIIITSLRHKEALQNAYASLGLVENSIENGMPEDFYSIDLMSAYASLGSIIGEEVGDDLVEEIFSKFCMGK
ncbi:MAG: tRNA uridine-5-carboxymethylaminomethyl(34) synthesis GTPase MnmE [Roseburia sp.]|nr:tRNA uridine-5-carboxymethylaminomethyl(34) synthesis GTPase MnmE [Roseburia sp.]